MFVVMAETGLEPTTLRLLRSWVQCSSHCATRTRGDDWYLHTVLHTVLQTRIQNKIFVHCLSNMYKCLLKKYMIKYLKFTNWDKYILWKLIISQKTAWTSSHVYVDTHESFYLCRIFNGATSKSCYLLKIESQ